VARVEWSDRFGAAIYDPRLGLARAPFDDVADPDMLYPVGSHQSAHSDLLSAVKTREGLMVLVGGPGTGKTTLLHRVIRDLELAGVPVLLCTVADTFDEMVTSLCRLLNVPDAGSLQGRVALGSCAGQPVRRLRSAADASATGPRAARLEGFSLHADVAVPARRRDQLERVCRYILRPPWPWRG
jgi:AAA domain